MNRRRIPDPWERRRFGRRPSYGSLHTGRSRRSGMPIWFTIAVLIPVALVVGIAWRAFGSTDATLPPVGTPEPDTAVEVAPANPTPLPTLRAEPIQIPGLSPPTASAPTALGIEAPEISAASAVVLDGDSLAVLYEFNARERRQPASLTKIVTAIVTVEHASLDDVAVSNVHYWDLPGSTVMGIEPNDALSLRNLLYGLMLVSGNEAAQVLAHHLAGSEEAYVVAMNLLVERLGLNDTQFRNVHGLSEPGQYSTAYDLALLSRHLMGYESLREIVGTEEITVTGVRAGEVIDFELYNHNPLLNYTDGVDGVKTGFTEEAGRTFAASVERDGHRIYVVLLDAPSRAQDAIDLIEWAYEAHDWGAP